MCELLEYIVCVELFTYMIRYHTDYQNLQYQVDNFEMEIPVHIDLDMDNIVDWVDFVLNYHRSTDPFHLDSLEVVLEH